MKCKPNYHSIFVSIRIHIPIPKEARVASAQQPIMHITFCLLQIVQSHLVRFRRRQQHRWCMVTVCVDHLSNHTLSSSRIRRVENSKHHRAFYFFDFFSFCIRIGVPSAKISNATNNGDEQMVSPLGIAKYLEDKLKAANVKHCETCLCASRDLRVLADIDQTYNVGTQTILQGDVNFALCLRCNSNLNSPSSTNSPFILKLVKSCDSVASDAKSSISCAGSNEKLLSSKKDDLMVNPILGHTPISERAMKKHATPNRAMSENVSSLSPQQPCGKAPYASSNNNNNNSNGSSGGGLHEGASKHHSSTVSPDELPRAKESSRQMQRQNERTTASSSSSISNAQLSNRSSAVVDGSKLFESFNRNLIKSIKVSGKCILQTYKQDLKNGLTLTLPFFSILLFNRLKNRICLDHVCVRFAFQMVAEMF